MNIIEYAIFTSALLISAVGIGASIYGLKLFFKNASPDLLPIQSKDINYSDSGIMNSVLELVHPAIPAFRYFLLYSNIWYGYTIYLSNPSHSEIMQIGDKNGIKSDSITIRFD